MPARLNPAGVGQDVVSFKRAVEYLRARPACWLLAALFAALASKAVAPSLDSPKSPQTYRTARSVKIAPRDPAPDTNTFAIAAMPQPTRVRRADLPSAFTGKGPASVLDLRSMEQ